MLLTTASLAYIVGSRSAGTLSNINSIVVSLAKFSTLAELLPPHRLPHYIGQIDHESGGFKYDREIWGPTRAQLAYQGRMGNVKPGDYHKYMGRTGIQLTGEYNYAHFLAWCVANHLDPPDFVTYPDLLNTDPWEGLAPIWFWSVGNSTGGSLNRYADVNDIENITLHINGGYNGFGDRCLDYTNCALFLCGFRPGNVRGFQQQAAKGGYYSGMVDGLAGPKTRLALHSFLRVTAIDAPLPAIGSLL